MLFLSLIFSDALGGPVSLTQATWNKEVLESGKSAFVKFQSPWCGHCKKMKPDWDLLGAEFAGSKTVLIGDVDCTVEKDLCSKYGVQGFPTLKYFTSSSDPNGDKYEGGRDLASLRTFASENLGPSCSFSNQDLCNAEQLANIHEVAGMSQAARDDEIAALDKTLADSESHFKTELEKLQAAYQQLQTDNEDTKKAAGPRLKLLRSVNKGISDAAEPRDL